MLKMIPSEQWRARPRFLDMEGRRSKGSLLPGHPSSVSTVVDNLRF